MITGYTDVQLTKRFFGGLKVNFFFLPNYNQVHSLQGSGNKPSKKREAFSQEIESRAIKLSENYVGCKSHQFDPNNRSIGPCGPRRLFYMGLISPRCDKSCLDTESRTYPTEYQAHKERNTMR